MKVWIAISSDGYSASTIDGVFASEEAAKDFKHNLPAGWRRSDCDIEEHEVIEPEVKGSEENKVALKLPLS